MASKKYKGKLCAYGCGRFATTADHVFAREFFLPDAVYERIKVPACGLCNNKKSELEHYLTAVLPFGGRHIEAGQNLQEMVPKRLAHNASLQRMLSSHQGIAWVRDDGGLYVPAMTLPVEFDRIEKLMGFVARGLAWHHWGVRLTTSDFVVSLALSPRGQQVFDQKFFRVNVGEQISNNLGQGTFMYEGVQGTDNPVITAWQFSIYGGLVLGGDPRKPHETSSVIGVFTGPKRVIKNAMLRARFAP
jgi:hypothetical protein